MKKDLGLFGIGRWGKNLARNFHELKALKIICDPSKEALKKIKNLYPDIILTTNPDDIFLDNQITKVAIATPAITHKELIIKSLNAKKDVFVEKPICINSKEAEEIIKIKKDSNNILMVGHLLHYHPCIEKIKELLNKNKIGEISSIHCNRLNLGTIRTEEDVFTSFAPHDISLILSFIKDQITDISFFCENILSKNIPDIVHCHLQFKSNVKASIKTSWLNPYKEQKLSIIGSKGMILFDDLASWEEKLLLYQNHISQKNNTYLCNKSNFEFIKVSFSEPLKKECKHFLNCCQSRKKPLTDHLEGIKVIEVLEKIRSPKTLLEKKSSNHFFHHPSATIDDPSLIGKDTKIWHYTHIMEGSKIGNNCNLGQNVFVQKGAIIGNRVKIQNNVSVYDGVFCEDDVFLGPSMVFTNVKKPRSEFKCNGYEKTHIKKGATIGANATIVCGITIGEYAFIGAGAVVTKDVKPFSIVIGNPAKHVGFVNKKGETDNQLNNKKLKSLLKVTQKK